MAKKIIEKIIQKADVLVEALPYIKEFYGKIVVIKYGGAAMEDKELKESTLTDIVLMRYVGIQPVIVHGGGPEINQLSARLGIKTRFAAGQRYTDPETMEVVEMVLTGKINKEIVSTINKIAPGLAVGLSGKDAQLIIAKPFKFSEHLGNKTEVDLGQVGDVENINPKIINTLTTEGFIPVISPVGANLDGLAFNINADLVAGALAAALQAAKLVLLTDTPGILSDPNDENSLIPTIKADQVEQLIKEGIITSGMIPKVEACLRALKSGVSKTHIIDGRVPHALLLEVYTKEGIGTEIVP